MKGMPYSQARKAAEDKEITNRFVREALAIQAANRPERTPPREMPVTPTLPRMPKPKRKRRKA